MVSIKRDSEDALLGTRLTDGAAPASLPIMRGGSAVAPHPARRGVAVGALMLGTALVAAGGTGIDEALANAEGGTVTSGNATITVDGNTVTVRQTSQTAVIDWASLNIKANEQLLIFQPSIDSSTLNRDLSGAISVIEGHIGGAIGKVFIFNPHGVRFTPGATVDVGSLIVSTADISNRDFARGHFVFDKAGQADAKIINEGRIDIRDGGLVALLAPDVENKGVITANLGRIALAAGDTFTIDFHGDGLVQFEIDIDDQLGAAASADAKRTIKAENSGSLQAAGGTILLKTADARDVVDSVVNAGGVIEARSMVNRNGEILLLGDGDTSVTGALSTAGKGKGAKGGNITITGKRVDISGAAKLDASGPAGGGEIRAGGDFQGTGSVPRADRTTIGAGTILTADALAEGDGGTVIVWSDDRTEFRGAISARGGATAGDGGLVEVSGKDMLVFDGTVVTTAENGKTGVLLLDPTNIEICQCPGNTSTGVGGLPAGTNIAPDGSVSPARIDIDDLIAALATNNVTLTTSGPGADAGDITLTTNFDYNSANTLTWIADNDITLNGRLRNFGAGDMTMTAAGNFTIGNSRELRLSGGALSITADSDLNGVGAFSQGNNNSDINNRGGSVSITAASISTRDIRTDANGAIAPTGGDLTLTATSGNVVTNRQLTTRGHNQVGTRGGNVTINATGNVNLLHNIDVRASTGTVANSRAGDVSITAGGNVSLSANRRILASGNVGTQTGSVNIVSTGGAISLGGANGGNQAAIEAGGANNGSGGSVSLRAAGDVTLGASTHNSGSRRSINARGGINGHGGSVTIESTGGNVVNNRNLDTTGGAGTTVGANRDAGAVSITAAGSVTLNRWITAVGGTGTGAAANAAGGRGGDITVTAGSFTIANTNRAVVNARGGRQARSGDVSVTTTGDIQLGTNTGTSLITTLGNVNGQGGNVNLRSTAGDVLINAQIDARGGSGTSTAFSHGAGNINIEAAAGMVQLRRRLLTDAISGLGGDAGSITVTADTLNQFTTGDIFARGGANGGNGGDVTFAIAGAATLDDINIAGGNGSAASPNGGNGGSLSVTAQSIDVVRPITNRGGNAGGANGNGGAGGNIWLTATGVTPTVLLRRNLAPTGGTATGAGTAGDGGAIAITGDLVSNNSRTLSTGATGGDITVTGSIDLNGAANRNLALNAGTGNVTIGGAVGGTFAFGANTFTGQTVTLNDVTTRAHGRITVNGDTALNADATLSAAGNGAIALNGTVDGTGAGGQALDVQAGNGSITLAGAIGGTTAVGAVTLNSTTNTVLDLPDITTNGGAVTVTPTARLQANTRISTNGGDVGFAKTINAAVAGAQALTIDSAGGAVGFAAAIGGTNALASLAVNQAGATAIRDITTQNGAISIDGAITLASATTTISSGGGAITLSGSIDGTVAGAQALQINAGGGRVSVTSRTGQAVALGAIGVDQATDMDFSGRTTSAGFVQTNGTGDSVVNLRGQETGNPISIDTTGGVSGWTTGSSLHLNTVSAFLQGTINGISGVDTAEDPNVTLGARALPVKPRYQGTHYINRCSIQAQFCLPDPVIRVPLEGFDGNPHNVVHQPEARRYARGRGLRPVREATSVEIAKREVAETMCSGSSGADWFDCMNNTVTANTATDDPRSLGRFDRRSYEGLRYFVRGQDVASR